jgi:hypothetical protein
MGTVDLRRRNTIVPEDGTDARSNLDATQGVCPGGSCLYLPVDVGTGEQGCTQEPHKSWLPSRYAGGAESSLAVQMRSCHRKRRGRRGEKAYELKPKPAGLINTWEVSRG